MRKLTNDLADGTRLNRCIRVLALAALHRQYGELFPVDDYFRDNQLWSWSLNDREVLNYMASGHIKGVTVFSNPEFVKYLKRLGTNISIDSIAAIYAMYQVDKYSIEEYIRRVTISRDESFEIPELEEIWADTFGMLIFAEQQSEVLKLIANFSQPQLELTRAALGKHMLDEVEHYRALFIENGESNGFTRDCLNYVWEVLEKHSTVLYSKVSALAETILAYQLSYIHVHFPVLDSEYMIKGIVGNCPSDFFALNSVCAKQKVKRIAALLERRKDALDAIFQFSDDEVKAISKVNDLLLQLSRQNDQRLIALYQCYAENGICAEYDDDCEFVGTINDDDEYYPGMCEDELIRYRNDGYYHSDFAYMISLLQEYRKVARFETADIVVTYIGSKDICQMVKGDVSTLNDSLSWISSKKYPKLSEICICHAFKRFCDHNYSLADMIHIRHFEATVKMICQHNVKTSN